MVVELRGVRDALLTRADLAGVAPALLTFRTQDSLTRYFWASALVLIPTSLSASTRSRKSIEYACMAILLAKTAMILVGPIDPANSL